MLQVTGKALAESHSYDRRSVATGTGKKCLRPLDFLACLFAEGDTSQGRRLELEEHCHCCAYRLIVHDRPSSTVTVAAPKIPDHSLDTCHQEKHVFPKCAPNTENERTEGKGAPF